MTSEAEMTTENNARQLVVVGVDGSDESVAALKWAASYAVATGATLHAILAWHYPAPVGPGPVGVAPASISDEVRENMARALADTVAAADLGLPVDEIIEYGHPAQALVDASKDADLLVVGSRGHGSFTGMLVGSVSLQCVSQAHCPVVVVRDRPGGGP
jgi:nucleotide-binding universal stress UspA family protein